MKFLHKAGIFFDRILDISVILAGILLVFVTLSVCTEVFLRYFLGRPTVWVVEISGYALLYITFLAVAWVQRRGGHVRMDLVFNHLNRTVQSVINVLTSLICAAACFILTWYGAKATLYLFQRGYPTPTPLRIPKFIIIVIIFVGSLLLFIQFLRTTYAALAARRHEREKLNIER